ncbi:MAG: HIT domain-containing protein [Clostridia bacterium]|nr:MAG: HIT domain-containing protein [Clostridia bacterium]
MERLWAPWRSVYVGQPETNGCFLCENPARQDDKATYIVSRSPRAFAILNTYPYNSGHLMVAPYRHIGEIEELEAAEQWEMADLVRKCLRALRQAFNPHGFNIGMNLGRVAGAGVPGHLHMHIVPRWEGDSNFMPVIAGAKVVSEALDATYERVYRAMNGQGE